MVKKTMQIIILCLFVVATAASPAYASCQCNDMTKEDGMNMPCHQASGDKSKNDSNDDSGCCGDACGCATGCTSAATNVPEASFVTNVVLSKYSISPADSLESIVHAVPGSPPKRLS